MSEEHRAVLEKNLCYKIKKAFKELETNGGVMSKVSEESQAVLDKNKCHQTKKAFEELETNGGVMSKLSEESQAVLEENLCYQIKKAWKQAKEDPSKLKDDEAIFLVNHPSFKTTRNSLQSHGLKSNHVEFPRISSPEEARDIITNVMSNRTVLESEQLHASIEEYQQSWLDHNTKSFANLSRATVTKEATVAATSPVIPSPQSKEDKKLLKGKRFMICGEFEIPTNEIKSMLHSFGVARTSGVTTRFPTANSKSKIDYLLVGQGIGTHDTTQRAVEKNIKVINLEKLQRYLLGAISSLSD